MHGDTKTIEWIDQDGSFIKSNRENKKNIVKVDNISQFLFKLFFHNH